MNGDDFPTPFVNAKVISRHADPRVYHSTGKEYSRGDPQFIMSRGHLWTFLENPEKWRKGADVDDGTNMAIDFGSYLDCQFLSPELREGSYAVTPRTYLGKGKRKSDGEVEKPWKSNATVCEEWESAREEEGKMVISHKVADKVEYALKVLDEDPIARELRDHSDKQVFCMAEWHDEGTGFVIPVKVLIDIVPHLTSRRPKDLFDFKTTGNGAPGPWNKQNKDRGLYFQGAIYTDVYRAATQEDRGTFVHLVIENEAPYHITKPLMALSSEWMELGRNHYCEALRKYCLCLKTGKWPSYPVPMENNVWGDYQFLAPKPWDINQG